jgi:hypothetical protein
MSFKIIYHHITRICIPVIIGPYVGGAFAGYLVGRCVGCGIGSLCATTLDEAMGYGWTIGCVAGLFLGSITGYVFVVGLDYTWMNVATAITCGAVAGIYVGAYTGMISSSECYNAFHKKFM